MLRDVTCRFAIGLAVLLSLALAAGPAAADKCTGRKLKAIAKKEAGLLGCQSKAAAKGDPSLATACNAGVMAKFDAAFGKAGSCTGAHDDCESIADDCRDKVRAALPDGVDQSSASPCEASHLKAAGKKAKSKLGCYAKAALKGQPVDTTP